MRTVTMLWLRAAMRPMSSCHRFQCIAPMSPRGWPSSSSQRPPPLFQPQLPVTSSSTVTASIMPGCAPRMWTGPISA